MTDEEREAHEITTEHRIGYCADHDGPATFDGEPITDGGTG